jgi:ribosomal protein S18 acetylase RimI-like enzyme
MASPNIRTAISSDIPILMEFDHGFSTDHVWQMSYRGEGESVEIHFQQVRLPRPMRVAYPRQVSRLADEWNRKLCLLVAEHDDGLQGYAVLTEGPAPASVWLTDLAVDLRHRRQGCGTALVREACRWAHERGYDMIYWEMQTKNYPAIGLARKLGFTFSGYSDRYYPDQDIALFFAMTLA